MQRVENSAPQGHQRDEQEVGESNARQADRERELLRLVRKAGRQQLDNLRREDERERQQYRLRRNQQREDAVAEQGGRLRAALGADACVSRNEGGIERAFGKDRAEVVRQPKGDKERVGDRSGAEDRGQHDVAEEAGQAREQRKAADSENPLDHARFYPPARRFATRVRFRLN